MSILAKHLAIADENYAVVGTDQKQYSNFTYLILKSRSQPFHLESKPLIINHLYNILSTPVPDVPYEKIVDFKKTYMEELLELRKSINDFEIEVGICE